MSENPVGQATIDQETRQIQWVMLLAFLLNLVLAGVKIALAALSGSLAVTAGAIDSLTDSVASAAVWLGVKLSDRQFKNFPLGLYKIENVISVVVAFFILLVGYEIARRIFFSPVPAPPRITSIVVGLMALSTVVTFLFGQYALRLGRKTESPTLLAEGHHRRADVLSSLVVLLSVTLNYTGIRISVWGLGVDQLAAVVVLVFIGIAGVRLLTDGMRVLLDASVDYETLSTVRKIIADEPVVSEVKSLVGRNSGRFRFLQADLVLRTEDLNKAHDISNAIEAKIHDQVPHVGRVMIHYEPMSARYRRLAVPLADTGRTVSEHFGQAPYFAIFTLDRQERRVLEKKLEKNPYTEMDQGKGIRVAEWLISLGVDELIVNSDIKHKGPGYVFANAGVHHQVVGTDDLYQIERSFFA